MPGRSTRSLDRYLKLRLLKNQFETVEADKAPFCAESGVLVAVLLALALFFVSGASSLAIPYVLFAAGVGYCGGWLIGWFMWGLFHEPQIEARKKGQGPV